MNEKHELLKAWIAVTLAFTIVFRGGFLLALFTAGLGFLLHELAHKYMAQKFGAIAAFRANNQMLLLGILFAFFGFIFLAPGAVYITGHLSRKENGIVSLVGAFTNLLLALMFIILNMLFSSVLFQYGAIINSYLGLFNLLPFSYFDGYKVYNWNKVIYFSSLILSGILLLISL